MQGDGSSDEQEEIGLGGGQASPEMAGGFVAETGAGELIWSFVAL
ncbi:hypothetical protein [Streptomyces camponoticapitis]|nr:hypothetical protein [Streptomyces camponoticapitis]